MGGPGDILAFTRPLAAAAEAADKPCYQLNTRPGLMHRDQVDALARAGVATVGGLRQGLEAIARVARFTGWRPAPALHPAPSLGLVAGLLEDGPRPTIHEHDAKRVLAAYGIPVTAERLVGGPDELEEAAAELGYPLAVKAVSDAFAHRSDAGLVVTGVADIGGLERAYRQIAERLASLGHSAGAGAGAGRGPSAAILVQEMIDGGVEVFAGTSTDETFGPAVSFGLGGTAVELLDDTALRVLPLRAGDAAAMIDEIRGAPLLRGFRGRPPADVESLIGCVETLAGLAWAERDCLAEIDLNPVLVRPEGRGCVVADALIVPRPRPHPRSPAADA